MPHIKPEISSADSTTTDTYLKSKYKNLSTCTVVLNSIDTTFRTNSSITTPPIKSKSTMLSNDIEEEAVAATDISKQVSTTEILKYSDDDSNQEMFEIEEAEFPHVPLYHLRDEGTVKWALLGDLCNLLKVKSKDTLLKMVNYY